MSPAPITAAVLPIMGAGATKGGAQPPQIQTTVRVATSRTSKGSEDQKDSSEVDSYLAESPDEEEERFLCREQRENYTYTYILAFLLSRDHGMISSLSICRGAESAEGTVAEAWWKGGGCQCSSAW